MANCCPGSLRGKVWQRPWSNGGDKQNHRQDETAERQICSCSIRNRINFVNDCLAKGVRTRSGVEVAGVAARELAQPDFFALFFFRDCDRGPSRIAPLPKNCSEGGSIQTSVCVGVRGCEGLAADSERCDPCLPIAPLSDCRQVSRRQSALYLFLNTARGFPYFGISRSALKTGRLPQLLSTIPHWAFSVLLATTRKFRFHRIAGPAQPHPFIIR